MHEIRWLPEPRMKWFFEPDGRTETCSMCGDLCAVKMVNELFGESAKGQGKKKGK